MFRRPYSLLLLFSLFNIQRLIRFGKKCPFSISFFFFTLVALLILVSYCCQSHSRFYALYYNISHLLFNGINFITIVLVFLWFAFFLFLLLVSLSFTSGYLSPFFAHITIFSSRLNVSMERRTFHRECPMIFSTCTNQYQASEYTS